MGFAWVQWLSLVSFPGFRNSHKCATYNLHDEKITHAWYWLAGMDLPKWCLLFSREHILIWAAVLRVELPFAALFRLDTDSHGFTLLVPADARYSTFFSALLAEVFSGRWKFKCLLYKCRALSKIVTTSATQMIHAQHQTRSRMLFLGL